MEYTVNTPCGTVRGCAGSIPGTAAYKGIRFATAGRWEYPKVVEHWEGVYNAAEYGPICYQALAFDPEQQERFYFNEFRKDIPFRYDEDCLMLNIFTPDTAKVGDKLPVIVYLHGGSFVSGCAHEKPFDNPVWPTKGVIGVTVQYRLGPLGFLCLPELQQEAGFTGNYGLHDQIAALQWLQRNISAFGGDNANITVMGQSAGAMSVQQLCLSPLSQGLIHKAVMCSGAGVHKALSAKPGEETYPFWKKVMELAGCQTLQQFRAISPETLYTCWKQAQQVLKGGGCFPVLDGRLIVGTGPDLLKAGKQLPIPYLVGSTSEDMMPPILYSMAASWAAAQQKPSYLWFFERQLPGDKRGAWHSSDLWYWFGTLKNGWRPWEQQDIDLSQQMAAYLTNFARTGNPNGPGLPEWVAAPDRHPRALCLGKAKPHMGRPNQLKLARNMFRKSDI